MFDEQYRRDNERLHAKGELLMEINKKWEKEQKASVSRKRFVRYGAMAAALVLVVGGTLGVLLSQGMLGAKKDAPAEMASFSIESPAAAAEAEAVLTDSAAADMPAPSANAAPEALVGAANQSGALNAHASDSLEPASDYSALYAVLSGLTSEWGTVRAEAQAEDGMSIAVDEDRAEVPAPEPAATAAPAGDTGAVMTAGKGGANEYSGTNVQVTGVDEADIVKTDGKYIYYLTGGNLVIAEAAGKDTRILSVTAFAEEDGYWGYASELYLLGDRLMIIMQGSQIVWARTIDGASYENNREQTRSAVYDVSNRAKPQLVTTLGQNGSYISSRLTDGYVYLVTSQYMYDIVRDEPASYVPSMEIDGEAETLPASSIYVYSEPKAPVYTVLSSFALEKGTKHAEAKALLGAASDIYCDGTNLILMANDYNEEVSDIHPDETGRNVQITQSSSSTRLTRFVLEKGAIAKKASGRVDGSMLNQFAIDIYKDVVRVVTSVGYWEQRIYTDGVDTYEWDNKDSNALYTLTLDLEPLGSIEELAKDEWVESVRFDGDIAYFVTFRQVDPLFTVDLSDAAKPKVLSTLKIPGFSEYLHVYTNGRLLGVGYAADEETGWRQNVKLSMFDTSDKKDVSELSTYQMNADYTMVGENHKSILVSQEKDIIAFPADDCYYVFGYSDEKGFYERAKVSLDGLWSWNLRGLFIGDCFYVLSEGGIHVYALKSFSSLAKIDIPVG